MTGYQRFATARALLALVAILGMACVTSSEPTEKTLIGRYTLTDSFGVVGGTRAWVSARGGVLSLSSGNQFVWDMPPGVVPQHRAGVWGVNLPRITLFDTIADRGLGHGYAVQAGVGNSELTHSTSLIVSDGPEFSGRAISAYAFSRQ
ncbi:MAG TPA: hypothetical protein VK636_14925 [Gemmatimonadaceae bacterium]|nr:hypothetical protein [Gemmatimonadaceae bacterium]